MGVLSIPHEISIDFQRSRYVAVNVKQGDTNSRNVLVSCCNNGKAFKLNRNYHTAYIRLRKPDGKGVLNPCSITTDGKVLVVLTNSMTDVAGRCDVDLIVFDKMYSSQDANYTGMFVTQVVDDGNGNIELIQTPIPVVQHDAMGNVMIETLESNGVSIDIPDNPAPFVIHDRNGTVEMASISANGEIHIPDANVLTTMTFYICVVPSVFQEGVELIENRG